MNCTNLLIQDHKTILRALDVLEHMAAQVRNDQTVPAEDVKALLWFLRAFADDHHQTKEESVLFPELLRTAPANRGPLRQMIFEHDQERSLVEGLEEALHTKQRMDFVYFANRLVQLLRTHIQKEDNILFDIADRLLSPEQDRRVTAEFADFTFDPNLFADLRRLEWAYLRRRSVTCA